MYNTGLLDFILIEHILNFKGVLWLHALDVLCLWGGNHSWHHCRYLSVVMVRLDFTRGVCSFVNVVILPCNIFTMLCRSKAKNFISIFNLILRHNINIFSSIKRVHFLAICGKLFSKCNVRINFFIFDLAKLAFTIV